LLALGVEHLKPSSHLGLRPTSRTAAARLGRQLHSSVTGRRPYDVIIEQDDLQLWLKTFQPRDRTQWVSDEAYEAPGPLASPPADLAAKDASSGAGWIPTSPTECNRPTSTSAMDG